MMRTTSNLVKCLAVFTALLAFSATSRASIVYDNSTGDLGFTYPATNGVSVGDEITLGGTDRIMTDFQFEYFLNLGASGTEQATITFYRMDGPMVTRTVPGGGTVSIPSPGSIIFQSSPVNLATAATTGSLNSYNKVDLTGISVPVPNDFTWAVTFTGLTASDSAGLRLFNPPTVGSSFADFWQSSSGTWNTYLFDSGNPPANFAARVTAVPEPTTLALGLIAGLGGLGYLGFKRRS